MKKYIIAIIGYANLDSLNKQCREKISRLSFDMGQAIIDNGYILATGGLGGVMKFASQGARESKIYQQNSILGIIPNYDKNIANSFVDLPLSIGFDISRNLSLVSIASAIIVIGGGAGSLNEISAAWQLNKLIISLGKLGKCGGWGEKLANKRLDSRRSDRIYKADSIQDAIMLLQEKLPFYNKSFSKIDYIMSNDEAEELIKKAYKDYLNGNLKFLGKGSEGFVFRDSKNIYKLFKSKLNKEHRLYFHLSSLAPKMQNVYPNFNVIEHNNHAIITYPYKTSKAFSKLPKESFQELLTEYYFNGIVDLDMQPKNLRILNTGAKLFSPDIGYNLSHFTQDFFDGMVRRAYAIYKLQDYLKNIDDIKYFLSPLNKKQDFSRIEKFLGLKESLQDDFKDFISGLGIFDIHSRLIYNFYAKHKEFKSIFDYGSGSAKIAKDLKIKLNKKITAFDIDRELFDKYKFNYSLLDSTIKNLCELENLIKSEAKFDSTICSLVLCHNLADSEEKREKIIYEIMKNICSLSKKHIFIVICNPLFNKSDSTLQKRLLNQMAVYSDNVAFKKQMFASARVRIDIHRPLSFYENLFARFGLKIRNIIQSNSLLNTEIEIKNSDFIAFDLLKGE